MTVKPPGPDSRGDLARRLKRDYPELSYGVIATRTGLSRDGARRACQRNPPREAAAREPVTLPEAEAADRLRALLEHLAEQEPGGQLRVATLALKELGRARDRAYAALDRQRRKAEQDRRNVVDGRVEP